MTSSRLDVSQTQIKNGNICICIIDTNTLVLIQVDALVQLVKHFGWTWVGVIAGDDAYGRGGANIFVEKV